MNSEFRNMNPNSEFIIRQMNKCDDIDLDSSLSSDDTTEGILIKMKERKNSMITRKIEKRIGSKLKMPNRTKISQTEYVAYKTHKSNIGLFTSVIKWSLTHLCLFIILAPSLVIMLIYHITFAYCFCQRKLCYNWTPLFMIFMLFALFSYLFSLTNYAEINDFIMNPFNSLIPIVQCALFKDAMVEHIKLRLYFLKIYTKFRHKTYCKVLCVPNIIESILKNYWIWGTSLKDYESYGFCLTTKNKKHFDDCIQLEAMKKYHSFHITSLVSLYKSYAKSQLIFVSVSVFSCIIYVILPSACFLIKNSFNTSSNLIVSIAAFSILSIFNIWTTISIALFIEVIFYRLYEYYVYMKRLTKMIDVNANNDSMMSKSFSNMSMFHNIHKYDDEIDDNWNDWNDKECAKIFLANDNNWCVWYENWSRIERLSSIYFENRANVIFALITCAIIALSIILYFYIEGNNIYNSLIITCFCGLLYFAIIIFRFVDCSYKLSNLELQQIKSINNQQIYLKHKIVLLTREKSKKKMDLALMQSKFIKLQFKQKQPKVIKKDEKDIDYSHIIKQFDLAAVNEQINGKQNMKKEDNKLKEEPKNRNRSASDSLINQTIQNKKVKSVRFAVAMKQKENDKKEEKKEEEEEKKEEKAKDINKWSCVQCTLLNDIHSNICQVCNAPKPKQITENEDGIEKELTNAIKEHLSLENEIEEYIQINSYLNDVITNIQTRSVSPKIAGVTLNKAFVKLAISFVITCVSLLISYFIRKYF